MCQNKTTKEKWDRLSIDFVNRNSVKGRKNTFDEYMHAMVDPKIYLRKCRMHVIDTTHIRTATCFIAVLMAVGQSLAIIFTSMLNEATAIKKKRDETILKATS